MDVVLKEDIFIGRLWFVGGQRESGQSVDNGLGIYDLLEGSVIVPKLEPDVHHLHGRRWLLGWLLLRLLQILSPLLTKNFF